MVRLFLWRDRDKILQRASFRVQDWVTHIVKAVCSVSFVHMQVWFVTEHGELGIAVRRHDSCIDSLALVFDKSE